MREEGVAVVELEVFLDLGVSEGAGAGFRDLSRSMEGEAARRAAREWIVAAGGVLGGADRYANWGNEWKGLGREDWGRHALLLYFACLCHCGWWGL